MRRRGARGSCGEWLDTAEPRRGPAGPLSARLGAPTRSAQRKQSPVLLAQPGTRQTTIPSFFSPHADERDKENARPAPCASNKGREDSGAPLSAWPVKILALPQLGGAWAEPPGAEQGAQGSPRAQRAPLAALELQGESQSPSKSPRGAGGDSCCCSRRHGGAPRNQPRCFPAETAPGSRSTRPRGRASAGTESTTDPGPGAAPRGDGCSPRSPGRAQPLGERGQSPGGSSGPLFCQDSQGNRVIAHRASQSPQGPEGLFTQDSEGNRVIKHC